jgi:hypothetical protein
MQFVALTGIFFSLLAQASVALAAPSPCTPLNTDIPVRSTLASAGFFANLRRADNSISFLMDQLISASEAKATEISVSESHCIRTCPDALTAVVFTSTPHKTLPDHDDAAMCAKLFESTQQTPIRYENRTFDSQEEAEEWYDDLTQGDGPDGEDLYARCPGACSPAYSSITYKINGKFAVSTSVVCGHARDKDDNQYRLSASVRWMCPSKAA